MVWQRGAHRVVAEATVGGGWRAAVECVPVGRGVGASVGVAIVAASTAAVVIVRTVVVVAVGLVVPSRASGLVVNGGRYLLDGGRGSERADHGPVRVVVRYGRRAVHADDAVLGVIGAVATAAATGRGRSTAVHHLLRLCHLLVQIGVLVIVLHVRICAGIVQEG